MDLMHIPMDKKLIPVTDHDCTFIAELSEKDLLEPFAVIWYMEDIGDGRHQFKNKIVYARYLARLDHPEVIVRMKDQLRGMLDHYEEQAKDTSKRLLSVNKSLKLMRKWRTTHEPLLRSGDIVGPALPPITRFSIALEKPVVVFDGTTERILKGQFKEVLAEFENRSIALVEALKNESERIEGYKKSLAGLRTLNRGSGNLLQTTLQRMSHAGRSNTGPEIQDTVEARMGCPDCPYWERSNVQRSTGVHGLG